jgi:hypothetical protein
VVPAFYFLTIILSVGGTVVRVGSEIVGDGIAVTELRRDRNWLDVLQWKILRMVPQTVMG